jgi:hypothetical protein
MPNTFPASRTLEDACSDIRRRHDSLPAAHPDRARLARIIAQLAAEITERKAKITAATMGPPPYPLGLLGADSAANRI